MAEPVHHPGPVRGPYPFQEPGLLQTKDLRDGTGGTTGCGWRRALSLSLNTVHPWRGPESEEDEGALLDFDLEALLELGPEVNHFLQELAGSSEEEVLPRTPVEDFKSWVTWRARVHTCLTGGRN